jgi:hypothetical protein
LEKTKKAQEHSILNEVATLYPNFPSGDWQEQENPDFIIQQGSCTLGIELTGFYRGQNKGESAHKRAEVVWQKTMDTVRVEFESVNKIPLLVHSCWLPHQYPSQADIKHIADDIFSLITYNIPQKVFTSIILDNEKFEGTLLEEYLAFLNILRVRNKGQSLWSFIDAGFIGTHVSEIQRLISSKNGIVNNYLQKCDVVWLIITTEGRYISSMVTLPIDILSHTFESRFEKVLFYDRLSKQITELKTHEI